MAHTPDRPHDATVHPRTRQEATEYAVRNRGTSDWYRHDGKNVEQTPPPVPRLASKNAEEIAEKAKGEPEQWFQHNPDNSPEEPPAPRCPTEESRDAQEKILGKEEAWYKHDENQDYVSERNDKLPDHGPSRTFKVKFTQPDTNDWYKHAEGGGSPTKAVEPPKPKKCMSPRKAPPPPNWYGTEGTDEVETSQPRMTHPDAEGYLQRNHGSATNWFGHDSTVDSQQAMSPRCVSKEGGDIAKKLGRESENWFDYDANKDFREATTHGKGAKGDRSSNEMSSVMTMASTTDPAPVPRVRPEAQEVAKKNMDGLMDKYLTENKDYNSARPNPRIKPEAADTASKNKGIMEDCIGGYPDPPEQHNGPRVKSDAAENAAKNKGTMSSVIYGDGNEDPDRHSQARAVRPEAQKYAQRNQGSLSNMFESYGEMRVGDQPTPRLNSAAAREIATRNQGGMAGIMGFSG